MARNKPRYKPKKYESAAQGNKFTNIDGNDQSESFAMIYESMLQNKTFHELNHRQKVLYLVCKGQTVGKRKPSADFPDIPQYQPAECFYLNWGSMKRYGIYTEKMHSGFYKDIKALIDKGFIEQVSSGRNQRQKSVYKLSSKWHES